MGGDQRLFELLKRLAAVVQVADEDRAASLLRDLAPLRGDQWMRLDEQARRVYTNVVQPWTPRGAAWPAAGAVPDPPAAVAASMSRDGRARERAVEWLSGFRGPAVAAAAVRCGDWVPIVADRARVALGVYDDEREVAAVVGVMLRLVHRRRGWDTATDYLERVREGDPARLLTLTRTGERACRVWALSAANDRGVLSPDDVLDRALRDPDPALALWCAHRLPDPYSSDEAPALADPARLLTPRRALVRAAAVELLPDAELMAQDEDAPRSSACSTHPAASGSSRAGAGPGSPGRRPPSTGPHSTGPEQQPGQAGSPAGLRAGGAQRVRTRGRRVARDAVGHGSESAGQGVRRPCLRTALERFTIDVDALLPVLDDPANRVAALAVRYLRDRAGEDRRAAGRLVARPGPDHGPSVPAAPRRLGRVRSDLTALRDHDPKVRDLGRSDLLAWLQNGARQHLRTALPRPARRC